jgi:four helix bundle protein
MPPSKDFNLETRTAVFGSEIIKFCKQLPKNEITKPLINQLIRSGTSVGANYCEADDAETRKDFRHKIGICKKEARETKHWLHMIAVACPEYKNVITTLWKEAKELNLIFNAIINSTDKNNAQQRTR